MQLDSTAGTIHTPYYRPPLLGARRSLQWTDAWRWLTALVVEVVYGALRRVVKGGGLVNAPAAGQQEGGGELQGRGQGAVPGVGGGAGALEVLEAAETQTHAGDNLSRLRDTWGMCPAQRQAGDWGPLTSNAVPSCCRQTIQPTLFPVDHIHTNTNVQYLTIILRGESSPPTSHGA